MHGHTLTVTDASKPNNYTKMIGYIFSPEWYEERFRGKTILKYYFTNSSWITP